MTIFESKITVKHHVDKVYQFLSDLNNHQQLMPENISNWSSTEDEIRFSIQNMVKLALKVAERIENSSIIIKPSEQPPFTVELQWSVLSQQAHETLVTFRIAADLNMMMKMMASGPLQKLADHETRQLARIFN
jgi:carbon monoxide dehydrogenase subunit G